MNGGNVIFKFTGDDNGLKSTIKGVSSSFGTMTKSILTATGITKAFSATMDMVKNSTGQAITRLDALNQFPKVMSNLNISTEESSKAIEKMSQKLQGLPTTLDQGALAVQRFTSKNGDVAKSTDLFLALNNAILAGGASTEIQASALEQMSQAYAKGKPDMLEWRTMMTAMPAQLKQVATAMGYVDADSLGEALREGTVSMDSFMATIQQLNTEGVNGFQSFEEQARNATGGIQTSITVMKTRVAQGMAEILKSVDSGLAEFGGLSGALTTLGDTIKGALIEIAPLVTTTLGFMTDNLPGIIKFLKVVGPIVAGIVATFKAYSATVKIVSAVTKAWSVVQAILNGVLMLNPIGLIVAAIVALIAIIVALYMKCEWFRDLVNGIFEHIKNGVSVVMETLKPIVQRVVEGVKQILTTLQPIIDWIKNLVINVISVYVELVKKYIDFIIKFIQKLLTGVGVVVNGIINYYTWVAGIIASIPQKVKTIVNAILNSFGGIPKKMLSLGMDIVKGIANGITNGTKYIKEKIKDFVGNVEKFMKKLFKVGSPSKLMEDEIGQWIPKGVAVGIEANTKAVDQAIRDMQKGINNSFGLSPQIATGGLHYSPNVIVNNNISSSTDSLGQTVTNIKTFANGSKNDYNYGVGV